MGGRCALYFSKSLSEGGPLGVEDDAQVIRPIVLDKPPQDVREEKRHFSGDARGRIHAIHRRKESAIDVRHRIHKEEFLRSRRHAGEYSKHGMWSAGAVLSLFRS